MATHYWHARMIHPVDKPASPGHYDLMIEGTMTLHNITYRDPVFSYHNDIETGIGTLYVFNASYSPAAYRSFTPYRLYHYLAASTCNDTQYAALASFLTSMTDTYPDHITYKPLITTSGTVVGYATVYQIRNSYHEYDVQNKNCFKLLGEWTKMLGHNHIYDYSRSNHYSAYTTSAMVNDPDKLAIWSLEAQVPVT